MSRGGLLKRGLAELCYDGETSVLLPPLLYAHRQPLVLLYRHHRRQPDDSRRSCGQAAVTESRGIAVSACPAGSTLLGCGARAPASKWRRARGALMIQLSGGGALRAGEIARKHWGLEEIPFGRSSTDAVAPRSANPALSRSIKSGHLTSVRHMGYSMRHWTFGVTANTRVADCSAGLEQAVVRWTVDSGAVPPARMEVSVTRTQMIWAGRT